MGDAPIIRELTREKCLENGVVPLQGLPESLEALHHSSKIKRIWDEWSIPKIFLPQNNDIPKKILNEYESKKLLAKHGFNIPKSYLVTSDKVLEVSKNICYPIALKVSNPGILHKTEVDAVKLNLKTEYEVEKALSEIEGYGDNFLVEEMITESVVEFILGVTSDNKFGLTITIGAGGIFTELLKDKVTFFLPVSKEQIICEISELKIYKILKGWRGRSMGDIESLIESVRNLANFVEIYSDSLVDCEINPLIVRSVGKKSFVADALIILKEK